MRSWLDQDTLLTSIKAVAKLPPEAKIHLNDPFEYMGFLSAALELIGGSKVKEFGESDRVLTIRKKDKEVSQKFRKEGNDVYLAENKIQFYEEEALELYTKSIAYAIPNSREMAMGFANRSAVLLKLERPQECLDDIELALNSNYPEELAYKLHFRKAECFSMLAENSYVHAKFWLNRVPKDDPCLQQMKMKLQDYSADDYIRVSDEKPVLPEIKSPSTTYPCASDAIEYLGPTAERKIVATRDIRVGEVLVVEKPYLAFPLEENHYCYCTHCLQSFWTGLPCDSCPNVVFCSEKCKESAWNEYHSLECPVMNLLIKDDDGKMWVYAAAGLRLLIKFAHEAGGLSALKERIREFGEQRILQVEWYKTQTLESIMTNTCTQRISTEVFQIIAAITVQILFYLVTTTDFFGIQYNPNCTSDQVILLAMSKNKDVQFVGGLLMKLLLVARFQCSIARDTTSKVNYVHTNKRNRVIGPNNTRGFIFPAFVESITTSCNFNIADQFIGDYIIFHSVCPIKKGEEIIKARCARLTWIEVPKEVRNFDGDKCQCTACKENWPTFDKLENFEIRAKSSMSRNMLKDVLKPLSSLHDRLCEKHRVIERTEYDKILRSLGRMMKAVHDGVHLPCKEQAMILNCLTCFYSITGMTSRWNSKHVVQQRTIEYMSSYF